MSSTIMEKLLMADREGPWDQPLTADELLTIGRNAFEPLFHEPPIGPVPDYLAPHWSAHGCVAEYEEKLEELDRKIASHDESIRTLGEHKAHVRLTVDLIPEINHAKNRVIPLLVFVGMLLFYLGKVGLEMFAGIQH